MSAIWDLTHKYEIWLEVELQACAAFERAVRFREVPAPRSVKGQDRRGAHRRDRKVTKHDVIAFLESLMDSVGPEHRFLHMGLTSSDIVDTSWWCKMTGSGPDSRKISTS